MGDEQRQSVRIFGADVDKVNVQSVDVRYKLRLLVTDENRGQITGLYVMASTGAVPIGNLIAGVLASSIGVVNTVILGASFCIVGSVFFMQQSSTLRDQIIRNS